jgi:hypothetical protein
MFHWWRKRQRQRAIEADADAYMARHGWHAYRLAGDRALDAYLLGDLAELERWSDIRALIREEVAPDASNEELEVLLAPYPVRLLQASAAWQSGKDPRHPDKSE